MIQMQSEPNFYKVAASCGGATPTNAVSYQPPQSLQSLPASVGDTLIFIFSQFIDLSVADSPVINSLELKEDWLALKKVLQPFNFQKVTEFFSKSRSRLQSTGNSQNNSNTSNVSIDLNSQGNSVPSSSRNLLSDPQIPQNGLSFQDIVKSLNQSLGNANPNNNSSNSSNNNNSNGSNVANNNNNPNYNNTSSYSNNNPATAAVSASVPVNSVQQALNSLMSGSKQEGSTTTPLQDRKMSNAGNILPETSNFEDGESLCSKHNSQSASAAKQKREANFSQYKAIPISTFKLENSNRSNKHQGNQANPCNRSNSQLNKENSFAEVEKHQAFLNSQKDQSSGSKHQDHQQQWGNYSVNNERPSIARFCSDSKLPQYQQILSPQPVFTNCFSQQGTTSPKINRRDAGQLSSNNSNAANAMNTQFGGQLEKMKNINALLHCKDSKGIMAFIPGQSAGHEVFTPTSRRQQQNQATNNLKPNNDFSTEMHRTSESTKENSENIAEAFENSLRKCESQRTTQISRSGSKSQNKLINLHSYQVSAQFRPSSDGVTSPLKSLKKINLQQNNTCSNPVSINSGNNNNNIGNMNPMVLSPTNNSTANILSMNSFNQRNNSQYCLSSNKIVNGSKIKLDTEPSQQTGASFSQSSSSKTKQQTMPSNNENQFFDMQVNSSNNYFSKPMMSQQQQQPLIQVQQFSTSSFPSFGLKNQVNSLLNLFSTNSALLSQMQI